MPEPTPSVAQAGSFLDSLMDTELYSIGAYFCDEHPELVDEVVARSEEIERQGLEAYSPGQRRADRGELRDPADGPRGPLLQGGSGLRVRSSWVPRLLLGVGAIALIGAIVSIAIGTGGPKVIKLKGGDQVQELVGGIQQDGADLGPPDAAVTISVFNDLQCSTCDDYEVHTVDPLIEEYARTGEAKFEFRNYSLGQAETTKAAYAATAAGQQDREWQFVETFFRNQDSAPAGNVSEEFLNDIVNSITDLDLATWKQDMSLPRGEGAR